MAENNSQKEISKPCFGDHCHTFWILSKAKPQVIRAIITNAEPALLRHFTEVALNCLQGKLELTEEERQNLKPKTRDLKKLACFTSKAPRRRLLLKRGNCKLVRNLAKFAVRINQ